MIHRVTAFRDPFGVVHNGSCAAFLFAGTEEPHGTVVTCLVCLHAPCVTWALMGPCALLGLRAVADDHDVVDIYLPPGGVASVDCRSGMTVEAFNHPDHVLQVEERVFFQIHRESTRLDVRWSVGSVEYMQALSGFGAGKLQMAVGYL